MTLNNNSDHKAWETLLACVSGSLTDFGEYPIKPKKSLFKFEDDDNSTMDNINSFN